MGSKFSQTNKEEKSPENDFNDSRKYYLEPYDTSISQKTNEYTDKSPIATTTEFNDSENRTFPFKFEWKGDGKEVLLTGDFNDWKGKLIMKKNEITGNYETILPLERKKYNFKFIIDGNWVCSSQYPTNYDEHQLDDITYKFIKLNIVFSSNEEELLISSCVKNILKDFGESDTEQNPKEFLNFLVKFLEREKRLKLYKSRINEEDKTGYFLK